MVEVARLSVCVLCITFSRPSIHFDNANPLYVYCKSVCVREFGLVRAQNAKPERTEWSATN